MDVSPFDVNGYRLHANGSLTILACGFNKAAGSTNGCGLRPEFRGETGADRLKNVEGDRARDRENGRRAPCRISRWLRASLISVGRRLSPTPSTLLDRQSQNSLSIFVPVSSLLSLTRLGRLVMILVRKYFVLVVFTLEIGVDNVKGFSLSLFSSFLRQRNF